MKHPSKLDLNYKCRIYGEAHGFYGRLGGWIYYKNDLNPICQGWTNFYRAHGRAIERFMLKRYNNKKEAK